MEGIPYDTQLVMDGEGLRLKAYHCPAGKLTIGYGFNLERRGAEEAFEDAGGDYEDACDGGSITKHLAWQLLENDMETYRDARREVFGDTGNDKIDAVLTDMTYNLGKAGVSSFRKMRAAVADRDWERMAEEMKDSRWYKQVKRRGTRIRNVQIVEDQV